MIVRKGCRRFEELILLICDDESQVEDIHKIVGSSDFLRSVSGSKILISDLSKGVLWWKWGFSNILDGEGFWLSKSVVIFKIKFLLFERLKRLFMINIKATFRDQTNFQKDHYNFFDLGRFFLIMTKLLFFDLTFLALPIRHLIFSLAFLSKSSSSRW